MLSELSNDNNPIDSFYKITAELNALHLKKSLDYGTEGDVYQNFRGCTKMGIPAWKGAFIRLQDKVQRIVKFAKTGKLANETVLDSFNDLAVYGIICRVLFEEETLEPTSDRKRGPAHIKRTRRQPQRP